AHVHMFRIAKEHAVPMKIDLPSLSRFIILRSAALRCESVFPQPMKPAKTPELRSYKPAKHHVASECYGNLRRHFR
ncbi:MAG TPA: hypothetical protein VI837_09045, partial [Blastocatellia bacterium]|nr:hypothetical protein [Blastocatellia bacterium]